MMKRQLVGAVTGVLASIALCGCSATTTSASKTTHPQVIGPNSTQSSSHNSKPPTSSGSQSTSSSAGGISPPPTSSAPPVVTSGSEVTAAEQFLRLYLDYDWSTTPNQLPQLQSQLAQMAATPLVQQAIARWQGTPGYQLQSQQTIIQATVENAQVSPSNPNEVVALMVVTTQTRGALAPQQQHQLWDVILAPQAGGGWQAQAVNQVEAY